ncbi:hypothetical protein FIBSPDRAFT_893216 [Athelia psychrophila]|uniref:Uncharacterized protein n=1 Tax=Athelia psychrophila TaxID=1759441 RepID=A0A166HFP8_9AGAM|nr:hypothetical protein FIBSPDRAFT_893216 [Fibularhizoctonia sp. CBS 109695]
MWAPPNYEWDLEKAGFQTQLLSTLGTSSARHKKLNILIKIPLPTILLFLLYLKRHTVRLDEVDVKCQTRDLITEIRGPRQVLSSSSSAAPSSVHPLPKLNANNNALNLSNTGNINNLSGINSHISSTSNHVPSLTANTPPNTIGSPDTGGQVQPGQKDYPAVWMHNMESHFADQHQTYTLQDSQLPHDFKMLLNISTFKQLELHIPESSHHTPVVPLEESARGAPTPKQPQLDTAESSVGKRKRVQSQIYTYLPLDTLATSL